MLAVAGHTNCRNRLGWWVRDGFVLDTRSTPIPCRSEVLESSVHGQSKNTWSLEQLAPGRVVGAGGRRRPVLLVGKTTKCRGMRPRQVQETGGIG